MLTVINGYYGLNKTFEICHISIVIAIRLCCSQFITLLNKCKSSKFNIFNWQSTNPGCYSVFTSKVGHYTSWLAFQSSHVLTCMVQLVHQMHLPSVVPLVHNCGSAIWLSSLFSEEFLDSGRSNDGSGGMRLLSKECP